jgi:excisionase family DNA binding protein
MSTRQLDRLAIKPAYTVGDVARVCGVGNMTVTRWIDSGRLAGFRIPGGSRHRRVLHADLCGFLAEYAVRDPAEVFGLGWQGAAGDWLPDE